VAGSLGIRVPKYPPSTLAAQVKTVPCARSVTDKSEIVAALFSNPHRQIIWLVYTYLSCPKLRFNPPRRFRMAIQAHLVELERKHKILESELHEALLHLSTDDLQITELKRRKLMVKDEIERLKHSADETFH
jgi:hypothetical protein